MYIHPVSPQDNIRQYPLVVNFPHEKSPTQLPGLEEVSSILGGDNQTTIPTSSREVSLRQPREKHTMRRNATLMWL